MIRLLPYLLLGALVRGPSAFASFEHWTDPARVRALDVVTAALRADGPSFAGPKLLSTYKAWPVGAGTWVSGTPLREELETARRIGELLNARFGYQLVLLPMINGEEVPAFDGVLLDENDQILANVSLKRWEYLGGDREALLRAALKTIAKFSTVEGWAFRIVNYLTEERFPNVTEGLRIDRIQRLQDASYARFVWAMRLMARTFVDPSLRPTVLLIEGLDPKRMSPERTGLYRRFSMKNERVPGILVVQDDRMTSFWRGEVYEEALDACERRLAPTPIIERATNARAIWASKFGGLKPSS